MEKELKIKWTNHFIELVIVIIGISVAFWMNNQATQWKQQRQKIVFLIDIKTDLEKDIRLLESNISNNEAKEKTLGRGLELIGNQGPIDSVLYYVTQIGSYDFFTPDNFTVTSLLQSGDFKIIDSDNIKKELLRLLRIYDQTENIQNNFLDALDQNFFPMTISKIDMIEGKALDPNFFYGPEIKNYFAFTLNETGQHIRWYKYALKQAREVISLINEEEMEETDE